MKKLRRVFTYVMAISMTAFATLNFMPFNPVSIVAEAEESDISGDVQEGVTDNGITYLFNTEKVVVNGYTGTDGDLVIPKEIDGLPVTDITVDAFYSNRYIKNVVIEAEITKIPEGCFRASSIEQITFPDTLKIIGSTAFCNSNLQGDLVIPEGVEEIGNSFYYTYIESVTLPTTLKSIGFDTFSNCEMLKTVTISEGVKEIRGAFYGCRSLETVELPDGLEKIGDISFKNCVSLKSLEIPEGVTEIEDNSFINCEVMTAMYIPSSVETIGENAFNNCYTLTIYGEADSYAEKYANEHNIPFSTEEMVVQEAQVKTGEGFEYIVHNDKVILKLYVGDSVDVVIPEYIDGKKVTHIVDELFYDNSFIETVVINADIEKISDFCFGSCLDLKSVEINGNVKHIGNYAFHYCDSLESVVLPDGIETMGTDVFSQCGSLINVTLPNDLKEIPERMFYDCIALETITIPDTVTHIGIGAFSYCELLKKVNYNGCINEYGTGIFNECVSLEEYVISDGVTKIPSGMFADCSALSAVYIPESVKEIADNAFENCNLLTIYGKKDSFAEDFATENNIMFVESESADMTADVIYDKYDGLKYVSSNGKAVILSFDPDNVISEDFDIIMHDIVIPEYIGDLKVVGIAKRAFQFQTNISEVKIEADIDSLLMDTFYYSSVTKVELPEGIKNISSAFSSCDKLKEIVIPDTVTDISHAFSYCTSLETIKLPSSLKKCESAFMGCTSLKNVEFSDGIEYIGNAAFEGCTSLRSVVLPDTVKEIGLSAFSNCSKLSGIYIPDNVTSFYDSIFENCYFLVISTTEDSDAMRYAVDNELNYVIINKQADNESFDASVDSEIIENLEESQELPILSDSGSAIFSGDAVNEIKESIGALDVEFSFDVITEVENTLIDEVQEVIETGGKLLDLSLNDSEGNKIEFNSEDNDGEVEISVSYPAPEEGEIVQAYYIAPDGTKTEVECVYDEEIEKIIFTTTHFSYYSIEYAEDTSGDDSDFNCDVNEDGDVNVSDIVALQRFLLGVSDEYIESSDVNNDSVINIFDLIILKRTLLSV